MIDKLKNMLFQGHYNDLFTEIEKNLPKSDSLQLRFYSLKQKWQSRDANFNEDVWKQQMLEFIKDLPQSRKQQALDDDATDSTDAFDRVLIYNYLLAVFDNDDLETFCTIEFDQLGDIWRNKIPANTNLQNKITKLIDQIDRQLTPDAQQLFLKTIKSKNPSKFNNIKNQ